MKKITTQLVSLLAILSVNVQASTEQAEESQVLAGDDSGVVAKSIDGPRDNTGKVVKANGKVYYHPNGSVRSKRVKREKYPELYVNDMLRTKKKAKAFLKLTDGSRIILEENSVIQFNGVKEINADKGIVLFDIKKQGELKGIKITTKTAVIGIKGTQFVIDASSNSMKLYMKEGLVNVEAKDGGTFRHILKEKQGFKDYMKEMFTAFSDYKKKQEEEFVEFVKSIDVPANKAISIDGDRLEDIEIPSHIKKQFKELDSFDENAFKEDAKKLDETFEEKGSAENIPLEKEAEVDVNENTGQQPEESKTTTEPAEKPESSDVQAVTPADKIQLDESMGEPAEKTEPKDPFSDMKI